MCLKRSVFVVKGCWLKCLKESISKTKQVKINFYLIKSEIYSNKESEGKESLVCNKRKKREKKRERQMIYFIICDFQR